LQVVSSPCWKLDPSRRYPASLSLDAWTPTPVSSMEVLSHFAALPQYIGLPYVRTRSAFSALTSSVLRFRYGNLFRGCSHSLMFRPPDSLATQDRSYRCSQILCKAARGFFIRAVHGELPYYPCIGYASRPKWDKLTTEDLHLFRLVGLSAAPLTRSSGARQTVP
jgi:hypothetical protein